ncbi:MAG: hypothetical protein WAN14_06965 [Candidatus Acidiferrales bacterium]
MLVRQYTDADLDALCRAHASQGFDYPFPDLRDPIFVSKLVLEDDAGRVAMASLARLTCEMYLLVDRGAIENGERIVKSAATGHAAASGLGRNAAARDGRERYAQMLALHAACEQDLLARGLDDVHAWLPPSIARRFGRRLETLGWIRDDAWTPYCFRLGEKR